MLPALATTLDAEAFGLTVTSEALLRASTRVRSFTGQQISAGTSTVTLRGPVSRLPQRPVVSVTSVVDSDDAVVEYEMNGSQITACSTDLLTVVYDHGYADGEVPDEVLEIVCTVAARIDGTSEALTQGVTQEQSGSASQTFGMDAFRAVSGLTSEEKAILKSLFPKLGGIVVQRP
jgi:hypothetical protein